MEVLFLSHMFPNSLEPLFAVFVCEKAKALSKQAGLQVVAPVSYFPFIRKRGRINFFEEFEGLKVIHPKYLALSDSLFALRWIPYYFSLKKAMQENGYKYDLINVEWVYPDCFAAIKLAHKAGKKVVVTVHGNEAIGYLENDNKKRKYIQTLIEVDYIVSVSNDLRNKMIKNYGIHGSKISVIPNGIDQKKFNIIDQNEARKRINLKVNGGKICVSVTRLSEEKALHIMIEAISLCDEDVFLYIIGDGPLKGYLTKKIKDLSLQSRVFLVGPMPHNEITNWLNAADFFLLSSIREGCPVVIHEALACGVPIVSTDVGGIPDVVQNGFHGILCSPNSSRYFADALTSALSMNWDRSALSEYGQKFTWDKVAKEILNILEGLK